MITELQQESAPSPTEYTEPTMNRLDTEKLTAICSRAAAGDTEARIIGIDPDDEFAPLGRAINRLLDTFESYIRESTAAMEACSRGRFHRPILLRGLPGTMQNAALIINRAAVKMKESSGEIARLERDRQEVVENVHSSIGAACEELAATAKEILNQSSACSGLAAAAVKETRQAAGSAKELTAVGETINSVVKLIKELAEETNMLAINASIEAAHAGAHGRGFAVVASGVKKLSQDTKEATAKISSRVDTIHQGVNEVTKAISTIAGSVSTLNDNASTINTSVNEQLMATEEITKRVAELVTAMRGGNPGGKAAASKPLQKMSPSKNKTRHAPPGPVPAPLS